MKKGAAKTISQVLGVYQILGGVVGLLYSLYSLLFHFQLNVFFLFYVLIGIGLYSFCLYAGLNCFKATSFGLTVTLFNQLAQLVHFTLLGFTYLYSGGLGLFGGIDVTSGTNFGFQFKLLSFQIGKSDPDKIIVLINLVPLVISFLIEPIKKAVSNQD